MNAPETLSDPPVIVDAADTPTVVMGPDEAAAVYERLWDEFLESARAPGALADFDGPDLGNPVA